MPLGNTVILLQFWASVFGLVILGLILLAVSAYIALQWYKHRGSEPESLQFVTLLVAVPRDNEVKIDAMDQVFSALHSIRKKGWWFFDRLVRQEHISLEIIAQKEDIRFYISCPRHLLDLVEKQIHGAWPGGDVTQVPEPNIFSIGGKVAFAALKKSGASYEPIKVYRELNTDPLSSITSNMAKMEAGESVLIQVLAEPAHKSWQEAGAGYISKTKKQEADPKAAKFSIDAKTYEAIGDQIGKPGWETSIRIVAVAPTMDRARQHLENITGSFAQFSSEHSGFEKVRVFVGKLFMIDFIYKYLPLWRGRSILNSAELATIFHFPNKTIETPHIHWLKAKRAPAPAEIPTSGLYLGTSKYRGLERKVYLSEDDHRRHMYIIGKTGVGKSEFLKDMALQDIRAGKGLAFIDPHGDAVEDILKFIPPERAEDVVYFDPYDTERPLGMNMLEANTEEQKHFVSSAIINLMYKLYDPHKTGIIGPRFEHAIRNAMLTVMSEPGNTFIEVVRVLTDAKFVQELLPKVQDPMVRRYWTDQIAQTSDFHKSEVLDYIVSKFGRFVTDKMMRNIIGQSQSGFSFRQVMDQGKILLINLAKGRIGEENSSFLGLLLVPRILMAAMSRQDLPMDQRKDFYLYVDEFQNFATQDFAQILSEARKYRLNLVVANQFIGQIDDEVKNAVFGNVGSLIAFRVGVSDANFLQHEFTPIFTETDLTNVERYHVFIKTIFNNEPLTPFSMDLTRDIEQEMKYSSPELAKSIVQLSRLKFGRDREEIEAEITKRAKL